MHTDWSFYSRIGSFYSRIAACAAVLSVLAMGVAPLAMAQSAAISQHGTPPAVTQQPPPPGNVGEGGGQGVLGEQGGGEGDRGSGGAAGTEAQTAGDGGTLPFTGYPMTMLIWLALILIGVGICVHLGGAAYRRLRATEAQDF